MSATPPAEPLRAALLRAALLQPGAVDRRELLAERRLLQDVVSLARRCDATTPAPLLDAVLCGTGAARPVLPAQRAATAR